MNLEKRISELEQQTVQNEPYDAVIYCSRDETQQEALQRFEREKDRPFSENGTIIFIDTVDATKEGGDRVLPRKDEPSYEPD
jgi:hypothetical protein